MIEATWAELRGETDTPIGSEAIFDYLDAVVELRDARAIPLLVETLTMGGENFLADFGAEAFEPVLAAVSDPGEHPHRVHGGLTVLRFLLEDGALAAEQMAKVREAARERLSGSQNPLVVKAAIRLALVLGDTELREMVDRIATDRAVAEVLVSPYLDDGSLRENHARWIDDVQEYARLFLSGGGADIGPIRRPGGGRPN